MRYCSVASGSNGNCHYIESGEYRVLVDLGLSARQIEDGLRSVGIDPASINGIFVTHEHSDHVRGIGVWARRYKVPILATAGTWKGMERGLGPVSGELAVTIRAGKGYRLGDMRIEAFSIYHDANEPVGYCFESGGRKIAVMTDTGMVTPDMKHRLMDCDLAVVESNHDVDMLMQGRYPWPLKKRIRSNLGHLSNEDCGSVLAEVFGENARGTFLLGHLSEENNRPELAMETVQTILEERLGERKDSVFLTKRGSPTDMFTLP